MSISARSRIPFAVPGIRSFPSPYAVALLLPLAALRAQVQFDTLPRHLLPSPAVTTNALAFGDVDGDGDLDLVAATDAQHRLYRNDGSGTLIDDTVASLPAGGFAQCVALGDIDGDGDLDLVFGDAPDAVYCNDGAGHFVDETAARLPTDTTFTYAVALLDVDGDDDLDLFLGNGPLFAQNRMYLNDGSGVFTDATAGRIPPDSDLTFAVAVGDVDGDGDLDLVTGNLGSLAGTNRLYRNDGAGWFTVSALPGTPDRTLAVALGDVDGDGDLDLVVGNTQPAVLAQNRLYRNDGSGIFVEATERLPVDADATYDVVLGDFDDDGDLDILFGNDDTLGTGAQNRLCLNDGTGWFVDATDGRLPPEADATLALALGDVDGDGDADLAVGIDAGPDRLLFDLRHQLDAPTVAALGASYVLDAYARHAAPALVDVVVPYLSTVTTTLPLPPLGVVRLDPAHLVALAPFVVPQPEGAGSGGFVVPASPALVGTTFYCQALLLGWPHDARLSNLVVDVVVP